MTSAWTLRTVFGRLRIGLSLPPATWECQLSRKKTSVLTLNRSLGRCTNSPPSKALQIHKGPGMLEIVACIALVSIVVGPPSYVAFV